jgi:bifunctional DNA-binding transcriptional regulator/antitoxin component of YhaV-PrlF toxin-antitoxin module
MQNPESNHSSNIITCEEDEEGNLIIPFPDELLDALGWGEGDELEVQVLADSVRFAKVAAGEVATEGGDPIASGVHS